MAKKSLQQRVALVCSVVTMFGTALAGAFLSLPAPVTAEEPASTSHSYTLREQINKVSFTEDEKIAAGFTAEETVNTDTYSARKQALLKVAVEKSDLKYYAFAGTSSNYQKLEYYDWGDNSNGYYLNWSAIGAINVWNGRSTEYGFTTWGELRIGGSNDGNQMWGIGWTAPADGVLEIPEHTLTIDSFVGTVRSFHFGWTVNEQISPFDTNPTWDTYTETGEYTIRRQTYQVSAGDMVFLNMYSDCDASSRTNIKYDPTFNFTERTDISSSKTTLTSEIAKVGTAEWSGDRTYNTAETEELYKTAFAKSDLKYYVGGGTIEHNYTNYQTNEYWDWGNNGSGYFFNWGSFNQSFGLWASESTAYGLNTDGNGKHSIGGVNSYKQVWIVGWTAPADGVLVIPEHTLTIDSFFKGATAFYLGWTRDRYVLPVDENPTWTEYTSTGTYTIAKQEFKVSKGDTVYLNMYSAHETEGSAIIFYDPTFDFVDKTDIPEKPYETVETTLATEIGKIVVREFDKTATGWDGSTKDAKRAAAYQLAFARSNLKFYVGDRWNFSECANWGHSSTSSNWYKVMGTQINGLGLGSQTYNAYSDQPIFGLKATGNHKIFAYDYNLYWVIGWTAPADGVLTIPEHSLTINSLTYTDKNSNVITSTALRMAYTKGDYLLPTESGWTSYTDSATIATQTFEVKEGDVIYLTMYADGTENGRSVDCVYNPSFNFVPTAGEMKGATLSTASDIGLNFYADMAVGTEEVVATAQMEGKAPVTVNGEYVESQSAWKFTYPVAAQDYDKKVTLTIQEVNGVAVNGATYTYSVAEYIDYVLADETGAYQKSKAVTSALKTYCESAKIYFNPTAEAVEKVAENVVAKAELEDYKAVVSGEDEAIELIGATLVLEAKTTIHVYFTADEATALTVAGAVKVEGQDNLYVVKAEVVAKDLGVTQTFAIGGYTVSYSAYSYIEACVDTSNVALYNVLQALYDYGYEAYEYFKA